MSIGPQIKKLREGQGLTQQQLADRLAITQASLGWYETGRRRPSYDMVKRIARALQVPLTALDPDLRPEDVTGPKSSSLIEAIAS